MPNVFTTRTLADRWDCSPQHIRDMIKSGDLDAFPLGPKAWRIPIEAVAKVEAQRCPRKTTNHTGSDDSKTGSFSSTTTKPESADDTGLSPQIANKLKLQQSAPTPL